MNRKTWVGLLLLMIMCTVSCIALANSWGLSGPLLNYVMGIKDFNDYSAVTTYYKMNCPISAAVMNSKYHNILLVYGTDANGDHSVWRSTTAVWQPDEMNDIPVITCTEDTVTLKTDKFGSYVFSWDENENTFILTQAEYGSFVLTLRDGVYYSQNGRIWQAQLIDIQSFNVSQFPKTEYDMLRMNRVYAVLQDASGFWHENITTATGKKIPVYSAPYTNSYRAAKGKASVNTSENFWLLASVDDWDLVEYEVSLRTHRIGWINKASLSKNAPVMMTDVPVLSAECITDDPYCSQYHTFTKSEITNIHLLALANPFYAYASAETIDGRIIWGFVPVKGCDLLDEVIDESAMSAFCGTWVFSSGGEIAAEVLALHADGSCELGGLKNEATIEQLDLTNGLQPEDYTMSSAGIWYVIDSQSKIGYEKTLILKVNGRVSILGLYNLPQKGEDGRMTVMLCCGETGGSYVQVAEGDQPLKISIAELTYTDPEVDAAAYGFGYEKLEDRWKTFFPEEIWSKARFLVDSEWEENAAYNAEHHLGTYRHYPIVTVLKGNVQVHLFDINEGSITKIAETRIDSELQELDGRKAGAPRYHLIDAVGEQDGIYRYRETLNLYFNSSLDPWDIQIVLETEQPNDPDILRVTAVVYQYNDPHKTLILGQKYDYEVIAPSEDGITYSYGYLEEQISDSLILPLTGSTKFAEFTLASFPDNPENLLTEARIDTKKHGSGGKVNLRKQPKKDAKVIMSIPNNANIQMIDLGNGWCFVHYKGNYGYVIAEFVEDTDAWNKN